MIVNRLCIKPGYLDALSSAKVWLHFRHWRLACARGLWGLEGGGMNSKIDHFGKLGAIQYRREWIRQENQAILTNSGPVRNLRLDGQTHWSSSSLRISRFDPLPERRFHSDEASFLAREGQLPRCWSCWSGGCGKTGMIFHVLCLFFLLVGWLKEDAKIWNMFFRPFSAMFGDVPCPDLWGWQPAPWNRKKSRVSNRGKFFTRVWTQLCLVNWSQGGWPFSQPLGKRWQRVWSRAVSWCLAIPWHLPAWRIIKLGTCSKDLVSKFPKWVYPLITGSPQFLSSYSCWMILQAEPEHSAVSPKGREYDDGTTWFPGLSVGARRAFGEGTASFFHVLAALKLG